MTRRAIVQQHHEGDGAWVVLLEESEQPGSYTLTSGVNGYKELIQLLADHQAKCLLPDDVKAQMMRADLTRSAED